MRYREPSKSARGAGIQNSASVESGKHIRQSLPRVWALWVALGFFFDSSVCGAAGPSVFKLSPVPCRVLLFSPHNVPAGTEVALSDDDLKVIHVFDAKALAGGYPKIDGVYNFRTVAGKSAAGFAQPSEQGIKTLLKSLDAGPEGLKDVLFFDLREEPVLFVDGKTYAFSAFNNPSHNLFLSGLSRKGLDLLEQSMKEQVLAMAAKNGGKIVVRQEIDRAHTNIVEIHVGSSSVRTTKETFASISAEGFRVKFERVPITDENQPQFSDVDAILRAIDANPGSMRTFHCHFGYGRTTTGLVISALHDPIANPVQQGITEEMRAVRAIPEVKALAEALRFTEKDFERLDAATREASIPLDLRADLIEKTTLGGPKYSAALQRYLVLMATAKYLEKPRELIFSHWLSTNPRVLSFFSF